MCSQAGVAVGEGMYLNDAYLLKTTLIKKMEFEKN